MLRWIPKYILDQCWLNVGSLYVRQRKHPFPRIPSSHPSHPQPAHRHLPTPVPYPHHPRDITPPEPCPRSPTLPTLPALYLPLCHSAEIPHLSFRAAFPAPSAATHRTQPSDSSRCHPSWIGGRQGARGGRVGLLLRVRGGRVDGGRHPLWSVNYLSSGQDRTGIEARREGREVISYPKTRTLILLTP